MLLWSSTAAAVGGIFLEDRSLMAAGFLGLILYIFWTMAGAPADAPDPEALARQVEALERRVEAMGLGGGSPMPELEAEVRELHGIVQSLLKSIQEGGGPPGRGGFG